MAKFKFSAAPFPANFDGTMQDFLDALVERLSISTDAFPFHVGSTPPAGNEGPWFKDGTTPYVWDENTSKYVPLDMSSSYLPQVWVGEAEPDSVKYQIWFKLSGTSVVGLFHYFSGAWTAQDLSIADGSIGTAELANGAVTGTKVQNLAVTLVKLAAGITVDKWEFGTSREFVRMDSAGTSPSWRGVFFASSLISINPNQVPYPLVTWSHGLPAEPQHVQLAAVWTGPGSFHGFAIGDEVVLGDQLYPPLFGNGITKDATTIQFYGGPNPNGVACPDGTKQSLSTGWAFRLYFTAA